jgi:hypothetical protein
VARAWAAVAALVALAAIPRALTFGDSLAGDEVFTAFVVGHRSPGTILDLLASPQAGSPESSPPLYFLAARLGVGPLSDDAGLRAVSLLAGLLTVPLVFALGRRVFSTRAGLIAAAAWALAPFAIFYAVEARPYGLLMCLAAASTLAVALAAERGRAWWALWALLAAGVVLTHYTGATLVAVQAAWGIWRAPRAAILASAGVAVLLAPWLIDARSSLRAISDTLGVYEALAPKTPRGYLANVAHTLPGHPLAPLSSIPGTIALILFGAALVGALALAPRGRVRAETALLVACALAAPVGLLAGGLISGHTVFLPRSLSASLPAAIVLVAALVAARRVLPAATIVLAVLALGAVKTLDRDHRRPDSRAIAHWIDRTARPGEPVILLSLGTPDQAASRFLSRYYERPHPEGFVGFGDDAIWRDAAERGRRVFVVTPLGDLLDRYHAPAPFRPTQERSVPGWLPMVARVYEPA